MSEKKARIFYYEEACDSFIQAPVDLASLVDLDAVEEDEEIIIRLRRVDMTDEEFDALPES